MSQIAYTRDYRPAVGILVTFELHFLRGSMALGAPVATQHFYAQCRARADHHGEHPGLAQQKKIGNSWTAIAPVAHCGSMCRGDEGRGRERSRAAARREENAPQRGHGGMRHAMCHMHVCRKKGPWPWAMPASAATPRYLCRPAQGVRHAAPETLGARSVTARFMLSPPMGAVAVVADQLHVHVPG